MGKPMLFNAKFFIASLLVSLTSGIFHNFASLWIRFIFPSFSPDIFVWLSLAFAPVSFAIGIVLPFAVMYLLTMKLVEPTIKPVLIATFLGCWIGEAFTFVLSIFVTYLLGGSYGYDLFMFAFYVPWGIFATAFSGILFISLTAIFFANFKRKSA
jgi:hypothetical protein